MKPRSYSVSINYRRNGDSFIWNVLSAITSGWPIGFLTRHLLTNERDYRYAVEIFRTAKLIAPVYITVAGTFPGQGAIITRDRRYEVPGSFIELKDH